MMRHLERTRPPEELLYRLEKAKSFAVSEGYGYIRPSLSPSVTRVLREYIYTDSHQKCVYCETPLDISEGSLDIFIPKRIMLDSDPIFDIRNYVFACRVCNANKGDKFEMDQDQRPLLLNPYEDEPSEHILFDQEGSAKAVTTRGEYSIGVLGLNRNSLVIVRKQFIQEFKGLVKSFIAKPNKELFYKIGELTDITSPFSSAKRFLLATELGETPEIKFASPLLSNLREILAPEIKVLSQKVHRDKSGQKTIAVGKEGKVSPTQKKEANAYIQKLTIQNFRGIEKIDLDLFPETGISLPDAGGLVPWKMFLGENACGKTTILQAIALAIMPTNQIRRYEKGLALQKLLHRKADGSIAPEATIELKMSSGEQIIVTISKDGIFRNPKSIAQVAPFIRGYGPVRLLPTPRLSLRPSNERNSTSTVPIYVWLEGLFQPYATLINANQWLLGLDDTQFGLAKRTLIYLLDWAGEDVRGTDASKIDIVRENSEIFVILKNEKVSLDQMSEGYQNIIALATDIIQGMPPDVANYEDAYGIVLLDEIEVHLHPRWKIRLISQLRRTFRNIQFIVTSQDPLCLRGLVKNEVAVMQRNSENVITCTIDGLPDPAGLRIDQLLTSHYFGLFTTVDPDTDLLFQEYYDLLAITDRSEPQESRFLELKKQVNNIPTVLGHTRRDQLAYEMIDVFLAQNKNESSDEFDNAKTKLRSDIVERWQQLYSGLGGDA